jgi:hypothetical protein
VLYTHFQLVFNFIERIGYFIFFGFFYVELCKKNQEECDDHIALGQKMKKKLKLKTTKTSNFKFLYAHYEIDLVILEK